MATLDLTAQRKDLYAPSSTAVSIVDVPPMQFLAINGAGDPNTAPAYKQAVEALFSVSYALKFLHKGHEPSLNYKVMPLEGLWWLPEGEDFAPERKDRLSWTLLIRQPDEVANSTVEEARRQVARKKALPALADLRLERLHEGLVAQIMHLGPFADEGPTVATLHASIAAHGHTLRGKHHEIYLSDLTRTAPAKLKTVLRLPVT